MPDDHSDTTAAADSTTGDGAAFAGGTDDAGEQTIEEQFLDFFASVHADDISLFAQQFPDELLFEVDWADLHTFAPDLAQDWLTHPDLMRQYAEEALGMYDLPEPVPLEQATVALTNLPDTHERLPGETRIEDRGQPIAVTGQVAKTTKVKPKLLEAAFECQRCGTLSYVPQNRGFTEPHECEGCERQGPFDINFDESEFINSQLARISEPPEETGAGTGRSIDVTMAGNDLVDRVDAGDRVTVTGCLQLEQDGSQQEKALTFESYLEADAIEIEDSDFESIDIAAYREQVRALASGEEGDPYDLLIESLAPDLHGDRLEPIKESIILQLFGGVHSQLPTGKGLRGDFHVLLLGDPGTAKSELLQSAEELAPRATLTSGKSASKAGMTAAAVQDDFGGSGEWTLEAGALVLAHKGLACVDELDKVDEDAVESMHQALSKQVVAIAKAGINTQLPARTSLLAAGNPKYGRFDRYESTADQIDLSSTLISRFDLMFMLYDEVDEERDREVITGQINTRQTAHKHTHHGALTDAEREAIEPEVPADVVRAWVAMAKQECHPYIADEEVRQELYEGVQQLRQLNGEDEDAPIPVTYRTTDGHQRIAEASARVRLSDTIEMQDVERAQRLIGESLSQVGIDPESGDMDADMLEVGASKSQQDRVKDIKAVLKNRSPEFDDADGMPYEEFVEEVVDRGHDRDKVEHRIDKMKESGEVYFPRANGEDWITLTSRY